MVKFGEVNVATIRDFDGGWNVVTSDLNLPTKYSKVEENLYYGLSGSKQKRYGTRLFKKITTTDIIETEFALATILANNIIRLDITSRKKDYIIGSTVTISCDEWAEPKTFTIKSYGQNYIEFQTEDTLTENDTISNVTVSYQPCILSTGANKIVGIFYYVDRLVAVTNKGDVLTINADASSVVTIFNKDIANYINTNNPNGWESSTISDLATLDTESVCFTVFNGILTMWNGKNKPLFVDFEKDIPCNYLVDEAEQSFSKVPIAKYAIAMNHYLVAGNVYDELEGVWKHDRICISQRDTIGTFNDGTESTLNNGGIYVDIGKIVSANISKITGLSRYRSQLIISFYDVSVLGDLGIETDVTTTVIVGDEEQTITYKEHTPQFNDIIYNFGCLSNKTFQNIIGDVVNLSYNGVGVFKKQNLSTLTTTSYISTLINPELTKIFKTLTEGSLQDKIWSVYNAKEQQYLLFVPNGDTNGITSYKCFAYTIPLVGIAHVMDGNWSLFTGWNFQCGCRSALNEVFLVDGLKIYNLGNADYPYYADFMDDPDYPADEVTGISGKEINFAWEFGWQDFGNRQANKHLRYVNINTEGDSPFTFGTHYDYIQQETCEQHMDFVGGDSNGWGNGRQLYGGARRTNTELLFAYVAKFHLIKIKIYGSSKQDLRINSISLYTQFGTFRR